MDVTFWGPFSDCGPNLLLDARCRAWYTLDKQSAMSWHFLHWLSVSQALMEPPISDGADG